MLIFLVIPEGLEPPTPCLEGRCSILLSYGTKLALPITAFPAGEPRAECCGERSESRVKAHEAANPRDEVEEGVM
jgi:hypothetical protein